MDFKTEIGRRIRKLREEKSPRWTLEELSRRTGDLLDLKRIGAYEKGRRMLGPAEAVILAKALGVRPAYIMAVDDIQLVISAQEEALVKNWRELPGNERGRFFRQIEQEAMVYKDTLEATGSRRITPKIKAARAKAAK